MSFQWPSRYTGLYIEVETEEEVEHIVDQIDRRVYDDIETIGALYKAAGVPCSDVVIDIGDRRRILSFRQFEEEYNVI